LHELREVYDVGLYVCMLGFTNKYGCWNVDCVVIERIILIYMVLYDDVYVCMLHCLMVCVHVQVREGYDIWLYVCLGFTNRGNYMCVVFK